MFELQVKKRTEELDYITLHLVPVDTVNVSGELFYNVPLDNATKVGEIINIQHEEVAQLQQLVADLAELVLPIDDGGAI